MMFKFTKNEIMDILTNHVRHQYGITPDQTIKVDFTFHKRFILGLDLQSASVDVQDQNTKKSLF